ncbi:5-formyltetrahydrofolate cyclo-ligase [Rhodobaculum claviforme]|uniref:5-formyltetrahydrofolate cyclo-ligase n=1 Tax=Rhodobaculum claviforme TaxID=1549854 RepID=A0A934WIY8_9RHOB|nr:5-formyltetrahydrofolate cyclo-ligase [Rhodobaculum claviforme]MBK5927466.1 5-formyltetrahydrofolate cyclo-ligase [Rhodobaculum claviforme]
MTVTEAKAALRARMRARRAAWTGSPDGPARRLAPLLSAEAGRVLAGYWPLEGEADPRPAMRAHAGALCLPVVTGRARPLVFREWRFGAPLVAAAFGVHVPRTGARCVPDVLIVPLLAFDRRGHRLGYGGGFYDRTLAGLRAAGRPRAIGIAFSTQEVAAVPVTDTDLPLDLIVTEAEVIRP